MRRRIVSVAKTAYSPSRWSVFRPPTRSVPTATSYAKCDALHRRGQYRVAKSRKAARKEVRTGRCKPHVSRSGYRANASLDRDKDETACEITK
jgi:hypothetical protein